MLSATVGPEQRHGMGGVDSGGGNFPQNGIAEADEHDIDGDAAAGMSLSSSTNEEAESKKFSRRPWVTAFRQQKLSAWQPILTPRAVWPSFLFIGMAFLGVGLGIFFSTRDVPEYSIDYTKCADGGPPPQYVQSWFWDPTENICTMSFELPQEIKAPVFLHYRLTDFYQNYRRYVKSRSIGQLLGQPLQQSAIASDCDPLVTGAAGKIVYPCGLIANSYFSDSIGIDVSKWTIPSEPWAVGILQAGGSYYNFDDSDIAWKSDAAMYGATQYDASQIVPPPQWTHYRKTALSPAGWTAPQLAEFNPTQDQHFQVWMRTAGLPTFRKLYGKNTNAPLTKRVWTISIHSVFDTTPYGGTKQIVFGSVSWLGGRSDFLGIAYIVVGTICIFLGLAFMAKNMIHPRKLGDHTYLSWNRAATRNSNSDGSAAAEPLLNNNKNGVSTNAIVQNNVRNQLSNRK